MTRTDVVNIKHTRRHIARDFITSHYVGFWKRFVFLHDEWTCVMHSVHVYFSHIYHI